jgi:pimeloyl-ACP methyl ester carboxylesterase
VPTRTLLFGYLTSVLCVLALCVPAVGETAELASRGRPYDALYGVYAVAPDHHIGINRFIDDVGENVILFADYRSGVVRRLYPASDSAFVMGPAFAQQEPVEMRVRFALNADAEPVALMLHPVAGEPTVARRVQLSAQPVEFTNGDARLAGTLIVPSTHGPHPAVILLHGSGPLTRHSFGPYPNFFASLGFAVLIFDKRGAGTSTGTRLDASTGASAPLPNSFYPDVLVEDALAAFRFLQQRPEIDRRKIGLWGSSEGGMLTTQVAARNAEVAFAINSSGFMGPLWETLLYQAGAIPKSKGLAEAQVREAREFGKLWLEVARTGKGFETFARKRDEARRSKDWMLSYFSGTYSSPEQMRWDWEHILSFDPLTQLVNVRCPVLALFGELDPLTDAPVAAGNMRRVLSHAGNRDFTFRIVSNGSHSLTELPAKRRMAPGVFDTLRTWLREHVQRP